MRILPCSLAVILVGAAVGSVGEYFPAGILGSSEQEHRFLSDWYSQHLTAMREPSLLAVSRQDRGAEVYRFLWLRTFHHPIAVRLTVRKDGTGLLTSRETNGEGGYKPGKLIRDVTTTLSRNDTAWFCGIIEDLGFWNLPTRQPESVAADGAVLVGLDGARWIMEATKAGRYHIVDRWSPPARDPVHTLGITLMIDLAHFKLLYQDVY